MLSDETRDNRCPQSGSYRFYFFVWGLPCISETGEAGQYMRQRGSEAAGHVLRLQRAAVASMQRKPHVS